MEANVASSTNPAPAKTVAAIDVGANALRMVIAEVFPTAGSSRWNNFTGPSVWGKTPFAAAGWAAKA